MTITSRIHEELFPPMGAPTGGEEGSAPRLLVRMPLSHPRGAAPNETKGTKRRQRRRRRVAADPSHSALAWSAEEHERFLRGLELFPRGPWKDVAHYVGTRTVRQTMTHAQKYRQKIARHKRGLQTDAIKKAAASSATAPQATPNESEDSAMPLPVLSVSVHSTVKPEPTATYATFTPTGCASGFQPIYSPSSAEEFAFDLRRTPSEDVMWQGFAPVVASSLAPFSPPASPHVMQSSDFATTSSAAAPAACDDDVFDFPLDDAELDALVIDDVIHSVIAQYLGPCPTNDSDVVATASWSFAGLP